MTGSRRLHAGRVTAAGPVDDQHGRTRSRNGVLGRTTFGTRDLAARLKLAARNGEIGAVLSVDEPGSQDQQDCGNQHGPSHPTVPNAYSSSEMSPLQTARKSRLS